MLVVALHHRWQLSDGIAPARPYMRSVLAYRRLVSASRLPRFPHAGAGVAQPVPGIGIVGSEDYQALQQFTCLCPTGLIDVQHCQVVKRWNQFGIQLDSQGQVICGLAGLAPVFE